MARELAQQRLEAEQSKFEVGMSTNFFVVQAQRDLARRRRTSNCGRCSTTAKSLVDFERVQETPAGGGGITGRLERRLTGGHARRGVPDVG